MGSNSKIDSETMKEIVMRIFENLDFDRDTVINFFMDLKGSTRK